MTDGSGIEASGQGRRRITLELSLTRIGQIDALKREWGIRNRGDVLERLLDEIFSGSETEGEAEGEAQEEEVAPGPIHSGSGMRPPARQALDDPVGGARELPPLHVPVEPDEHTALVLIDRGSLQGLRAELEWESGGIAEAEHNHTRGSGVDLPGFVRRRSGELRRSFHRDRGGADATCRDPLPQLSIQLVEEAMEAAAQHWIGLYGKAADETVLEASMVWLGTEIWPQSDLSDGRTFTWSACSRLMAEIVPAWRAGPPGFERVMVTAGVLEDPFSGATLSLRIPTLIRRFVHRFRRRRRGTSFQTLEHTMTLQGALKLLGLPIDPGRRVTLAQIREAYREQALNHHPDSGGSAESMRRLNEAYQLLKELYRPGDHSG